MRNLALLLALVGSALPGFAAQRATVEQLERMLAQSEGKPDAELARQLAGMELTERLSSARLLQLKANVSGDRSRQALRLLADESAFLKPPASEIPATATPDLAAQRRMMAQTVNYLGKSLPLLPNLFATRDTTRYESAPQSAESAGQLPALHEVARSAVTVFYRDSHEFIEAGARKSVKNQPPERGLTSWGEFGSILGIVMIDAARSSLAWSRWELGPTGLAGVFLYSVPKEKSHYDVRFCCIATVFGMESDLVNERAGYHGEITVDPANGAILRLTVEADLDPANPIGRASIAVEYAPVEIGGKMYICPVRSVALALAPDPRQLHRILAERQSSEFSPIKKTSLTEVLSVPHQILLNDIAFRQYHLFRVEARILPGKPELASTEGHGASASQPVMIGSSNESANSAAQPSKPGDEAANEAAAEPPASTSEAPAEPAAEKASNAAAADVPPAEPVVPEVSFSEAAGLPQEPNAEKPSAPDDGFTLHIASHLVDVGVVALDKKGRPVTNLKPGDFEIYDNGVKQEVRSFEQANAAAPPQIAAPAAPAPEQPLLTNRPVSANQREATETNNIVLLVDGSNLSSGDFSDARAQMLDFLKAAPKDERVALYVMKYHGFQVLEEATTDHEGLAAKLRQWAPTAQDVGNANDEEMRNRQQIETVHSPEDLLSVNGNFTLDQESQSEAIDAKLRELGSMPGPIAMYILVDVARHLAAVPGHKSLVWVTSDNALADWNKMSVTIEKTSKFIEPAALHVQEAMNNAHVSVYPLDASRLEASVITADIGRRNVELTPTFQLPLGVEHEMEGPEMRATQDVNPYNMGRDLRPGRQTAQMQQDLHPIQGAFREVAEATGGQALRRSNNMVGQLNGVVNDGRATYELSFSPSEAADGKYHVITVKVGDRRDIALRYRTGFEYEKEPSSMKDRFTKAIWQPKDISDVAFSVTPTAADPSSFKMSIAATDLAMAQQGDLWTDRVDVFLVRRDDAGLHAQITGETIHLRLKGETYQKFLRDGIPFDQVIEPKQGAILSRIIVVDENSGRMGSLTIPAAVTLAKR